MIRTAVLFFRSLLYVIVLLLLTALMAFCGLFILYSKKLSCKNAVFWSWLALLSLRLICGVEVEFRGLDIVRKYKDKGVIFAPKHQSALDVIALTVMLDCPVFISKKSVVFVPFVGLYAFAIGVIFIDREDGVSSVMKIKRGVVNALDNEKRNVVIFPEGTRSTIGDSSPNYKPGLSLIARNREVVPIALNTGLSWPRNAFIKKPGKVVMECLPSIICGSDKRGFMKELVEVIESKCNDLS